MCLGNDDCICSSAWETIWWYWAFSEASRWGFCGYGAIPRSEWYDTWQNPMVFGRKFWMMSLASSIGAMAPNIVQHTLCACTLSSPSPFDNAIFITSPVTTCLQWVIRSPTWFNQLQGQHVTKPVLVSCSVISGTWSNSYLKVVLLLFADSASIFSVELQNLSFFNKVGLKVVSFAIYILSICASTFLSAKKLNISKSWIDPELWCNRGITWRGSSGINTWRVHSQVCSTSLLRGIFTMCKTIGSSLIAT